MLECKYFFDELKKSGLEFFTGVPDSLLKNFCFYIADVLPPEQHIITANEGSAVGLATGYHLATGKIPVVYLQNSGLGNTINPILSVADPEVYGIPMVLIIGWRGEPGVKDEPQHKKQGRVMLEMLKSMEIPFDIIDKDTKNVPERINQALTTVKEKSCTFVFAVREGTFSDYEYKNVEANPYQLTREAAIDSVLNCVKKEDVVVCTTGKASRELYELRNKRSEENRADFLVVGSMGHCSQIALGVALQKPNKKIYCIDGDGSSIMHMGSFATTGRLAPKNFVHILINNGAHESVGGQPTGAFEIDWGNVVKSCGYKSVLKVDDPASLQATVTKAASMEGPVLVEVRTTQGSRKDLGRPKSTPLENKKQFMKALNE
jgi:phosphonopyruvate decarboxylase